MALALVQSRIAEMRRFWLTLLRRNAPESGPIRLDRRRIYVLPTRSGLLFGLVLLAMLVGAINYSNSLAYALTFLLASLAVVSILHTFRNLHGLQFHAGHPQPVFAGTVAHFPLGIENRAAQRFAVSLALPGQEPQFSDLPADELRWSLLALPAERRGWLPLPRITVATTYPLGLFRAWGYLHFSSRALVYPPLLAEQPLPNAEVEGGNGSGSTLRRGSDDFAHLRPYQPGDSLRHIHWKAYAREQGLVVKEFGSPRSTEMWLTWESALERDSESRLARLATWVMQAERAGTAYGLMLPGVRIEPALGETHRRRALEQLALYGSEVGNRG